MRIWACPMASWASARPACCPIWRWSLGAAVVLWANWFFVLPA